MHMNAKRSSTKPLTEFGTNSIFASESPLSSLPSAIPFEPSSTSQSRGKNSIKKENDGVVLEGILKTLPSTLTKEPKRSEKDDSNRGKESGRKTPHSIKEQAKNDLLVSHPMLSASPSSKKFKGNSLNTSQIKSRYGAARSRTISSGSEHRDRAFRTDGNKGKELSSAKASVLLRSSEKRLCVSSLKTVAAKSRIGLCSAPSTVRTLATRRSAPFSKGEAQRCVDKFPSRRPAEPPNSAPARLPIRGGGGGGGGGGLRRRVTSRPKDGPSPSGPRARSPMPPPVSSQRPSRADVGTNSAPVTGRHARCFAPTVSPFRPPPASGSPHPPPPPGPPPPPPAFASQRPGFARRPGDERSVRSGSPTASRFRRPVRPSTPPRQRRYTKMCNTPSSVPAHKPHGTERPFTRPTCGSMGPSKPMWVGPHVALPPPIPPPPLPPSPPPISPSPKPNSDSVCTLDGPSPHVENLFLTYFSPVVVPNSEAGPPHHSPARPPPLPPPPSLTPCVRRENWKLPDLSETLGQIVSACHKKEMLKNPSDTIGIGSAGLVNRSSPLETLGVTNVSTSISQTGRKVDLDSEISPEEGDSRSTLVPEFIPLPLLLPCTVDQQTATDDFPGAFVSELLVRNDRPTEKGSRGATQPEVKVAPAETQTSPSENSQCFWKALDRLVECQEQVINAFSWLNASSTAQALRSAPTPDTSSRTPAVMDSEKRGTSSSFSCLRSDCEPMVMDHTTQCPSIGDAQLAKRASRDVAHKSTYWSVDSLTGSDTNVGSDQATTSKRAPRHQELGKRRYLCCSAKRPIVLRRGAHSYSEGFHAWTRDLAEAAAASARNEPHSERARPVSQPQPQTQQQVPKWCPRCRNRSVSGDRQKHRHRLGVVGAGAGGGKASPVPVECLYPRPSSPRTPRRKTRADAHALNAQDGAIPEGPVPAPAPPAFANEAPSPGSTPTPTHPPWDVRRPKQTDIPEEDEAQEEDHSEDVSARPLRPGRLPGRARHCGLTPHAPGPLLGAGGHDSA